MDVPFFRPDISDGEVEEVAAVLRSGWLTTGPRVQGFEEAFAAAVGARYAVALNSCTAGLHLAVAALGLAPRRAVLVPAMTFAATAEVVLYLGAVPVLVDCDPVTLNLDLEDAERKIADLKTGHLDAQLGEGLEPVGIMPVHVGGLMMDVGAVREFADRHGLWIAEDAAHAFPAAWRQDDGWQRCGEDTADVSCFSFYANKTITTGEGGMAVTADRELAERLRLLSLHGLSSDAWGRYTARGSWDYRIVAPGYKYNLTDVAAALGLGQLERAEEMRGARREVARRYLAELAEVDEIELPPDPEDRVHAWHLFPIRLRLDRLTIDRDAFLAELRSLGIGSSVHWRPLHLHPYYEETWGWRPDQLPVAGEVWKRTVSLPIFPSMTPEEHDAVVHAVLEVCQKYRYTPLTLSPTRE